MKKKLLCLLGAVVMSFTAYSLDITTDVVVVGGGGLQEPPELFFRK